MTNQTSDVRDRMLRQCRVDIKGAQDRLAFHLRNAENPEAARHLRTLINLNNELEMLETLSPNELEAVLLAGQ